MAGRAAMLPLLLLAALLAANPAVAASRYTVRYANGEWGEGNRLHDWDSHTAKPKLDGRPLLEPGNPFRWLIDRTRRPAAQDTAFVELIGGDRLPGEIRSYEGTQTTGMAAPPHFLVGTAEVLLPPEAGSSPSVRVVARFVRRLVWDRKLDAYEPGTALFRNGRRLSFRAARLEAGGAQLLTAEGTERCNFSELAELHLPAADPWEAYLEELAVLLPGLSKDSPGRLLQLETLGGMLVTATPDRFAAYVHGNPQDSSRWIHGLQPAWSLDVLWIPCEQVWIRRYFPADRPPLSRWLPARAEQRPLLGGGSRPPRRDRNVEGEVLESGTRMFGWGWGSHAPAELEFEVPAAAIGLRTSVGIDRTVGAGGCVKAKIAWSEGNAKIWESDFLLGGKEAVDTGELSWPPGEKPRRLKLELHAAHEGRPSGADPFDIRDSADWLDPELRLDAAQLTTEVQARSIARVDAWNHWHVQVLEGGSLRWQTTRPADPAKGDFRLGVAAIAKPLRLSRTLAVGKDDEWLLISADQPQSGGSLTKLTVRIGEAPPSELEIPRRGGDKDGPPPLAVALRPYQGQEVVLSLEQQPAEGEPPVTWHAIRAVPQLPTLYTLLEETGEFEPLDGQPAAQAVFTDTDHHFGARSLRLEPDGRFRLALPEPVSVRQDPRYGEYRYLRFAFRKFGKGRACLELGHAAEEEKPVRYDAGMGEPSYGKATRVWALELPAEWIVMTRDLYAEFGELEVNSLTLSGLGGEHVLFDHVYLGRTQADFDLIPAVPPEVANRQARRELAKEVRAAALPATVSLQVAGRGGTGLLVTSDGQVLTAGHVAVKPGEAVKAWLADGRELAGKVLGISRDENLALLQLERPKDVELSIVQPTEGELQEAALHLAVAHEPGARPGAEPAAHIVAFRQVFREMLWTDFDPPQVAAGGPLFNEAGRLLGIQTRRSSYGGLLYARLDREFSAKLDRLRRGEFWGEWASGTGPTMGVEITTVQEGCRVTKVFPETPAQRAGVQVGDIFTRVDGAPVVSLLDVYDALADRDPGQMVEVEYMRNGQAAKFSLELVPRVP